MTAREMMEYLSGWELDTEIAWNVVDVRHRIRWGGEDNMRMMCITDAPCPAIFFEIGEGEPFDEELTRVAEECEREANEKA